MNDRHPWWVEGRIADAYCPNCERNEKRIKELEAENEQWKDMMSDANTLLSLLAEGLGVSYEPHQTLHERLLQAAPEKDQ